MLEKIEGQTKGSVFFALSAGVLGLLGSVYMLTQYEPAPRNTWWTLIVPPLVGGFLTGFLAKTNGAWFALCVLACMLPVLIFVFLLLHAIGSSPDDLSKMLFLLGTWAVTLAVSGQLGELLRRKLSH